MSVGDQEFSTWRMLSFTTSNREIDYIDWFALEVRCYGKSFTIRVSREDFHESPALESEFDALFNTLLSEINREPPPLSEDGDVEQHSVDEGKNQLSEQNRTHKSITSELSVTDCFDWAMKPCLSAIERLAPRPTIDHGDKITLEYFFCLDRYEARLSAIQDEFLEPQFQRAEDFAHYDYSDSPQEDTPRWQSKTTFPVFSRSEIEVTPEPDSPEYILIDKPTHVQVHDRQLYFKHVGEDQDLAIIEVDKYENMKWADFPADIRTSRLFGIVEGEKEEILGLLYEDLGREVLPLDDEEVMSPQTPEEYRRRWISQIRRTVQALHEAEITWGDAKAGNVLVDKNGHGDAWVIDFGGGYTEGWVDRDTSNTIEGDLQGLAKIIDYLET